MAPPLNPLHHHTSLRAMAAGRAASARELRASHQERVTQARSTVCVTGVEETAAHELALRAALAPMGRITDVFLKEVEGTNQSWALVTFADEVSAQRAAVPAQRKAYGCERSVVRWTIKQVSADVLLDLQSQFLSTTLTSDDGRVAMMREAFDKGVPTTELFRYRREPTALAKASHDKAEGRLEELSRLKAKSEGKKVARSPSPEAAEQVAERRQKQAERRKRLLGYDGAGDEAGGTAVSKLVGHVGREARKKRGTWVVPPPPASDEANAKETNRLNVAVKRLHSLAQLQPRPPSSEPPPPKKKERKRMVLMLPNAPVKPTWPRSTGLGSTNPRILFDVPYTDNPYSDAPTEPGAAADLRRQRQDSWKAAKGKTTAMLQGWRRESGDIVVTDNHFLGLLRLCGAPTQPEIEEGEEARVKVGLLQARSVFQKLLFFASQHPELVPLVEELRRQKQLKVKSGPWITKLRQKTDEIAKNCPDGRPSLRSARKAAHHHHHRRGVEEQQPQEEVDHEAATKALMKELPELNAKVDELMRHPTDAKWDPTTALKLIDDWIGRRQDNLGDEAGDLMVLGGATDMSSAEIGLLTRRCVALAAQGETARSMNDSATVAELRPSNPRPHVQLAHVHTDRAWHGNSGEHFAATECLLDAARIAPQSVPPSEVEASLQGVRLDRAYRELLEAAKTVYPTQDSITAALHARAPLLRRSNFYKRKQVVLRKKTYDWHKVDVSDIIMEQQRVRAGLLLMAEDVDGVTESELNDLMRNMQAQQLPKPMIHQVRQLCIDGEIDEDDRAVLLDLAPPERYDNLQSLHEVLETLEQKLLAIFRHYCYLISAGHSGLNDRTDAVSAAQFKVFVKDAGMADGPHALKKSVADHIFLRAMFDRRGVDGMGGRGDQTQQAIAAVVADPTGGKKPAAPAKAQKQLGQARAGESRTLGSDGTQRCLELYEFTSALVRLANQRYPNMIGKGLAAKVMRFKTEVLDKMEAGGVFNLEQLMGSRLVVARLKEHKARLSRVFETFAKGTSGGRTTLAASRTISMDEFESFCEAAGLIPKVPKRGGEASVNSAEVHNSKSLTGGPANTRNDGTPYLLNRMDPREVFVEVNLDDDLYDQEDDDNEADEIVYGEFTECLVLLAQRQLSFKAAQESTPAPKTFPASDVAEELQSLVEAMWVPLAKSHKELRGIDRVKKKKEPADSGEASPEKAATVAKPAAATVGRRAGGTGWTRLPWRSQPSVPLHPRPATADGLRRGVSPRLNTSPRPISRESLELHGVKGLTNLAFEAIDVSGDDIHAAMHMQEEEKKEELIELLVDNAAESGDAYLDEALEERMYAEDPVMETGEIRSLATYSAR